MSGSTNMIECKNVDEKILDYLYEELEATEQEAFRAHVEGCARCKAELESFGRVRSAAKAVMLAEPPQAASAKLLYQAAQLAPRGKVLPFGKRVARLVRHPAFAMAAAFVVVGGVAGWQLFNHRMAMPAPEAVAPAPVQTPVPAPVVAADPAMRPAVTGEIKTVTTTPVPNGQPPSLDETVAASPVGNAKGRVAVTSAPLGAKVMIDGAADKKSVVVTRQGYDQAAATLTLESNRSSDSPSTKNAEMKNAPADARLTLDPIARDDNLQKPMHHASANRPEAKPAPKEMAPPPPPKVVAAPELAKRADFDLRSEKAAPAKDQASRLGGDSIERNGVGAGGAGGAPRRSEVALADGENEELSRSVAKGKKAPSMGPPPVSSLGRGNSFADDDGVQEGQEILRQKNAADRKSSLGSRFGSGYSNNAPRAVSKPTPTPAAPAAQSQAMAVPRSPQPDEQQQLIARLNSKPEGDCTGEGGLYRDLVEHFPDDVTPDLRFKHAKCELRAGRYGEAKKLLQLLRQQAPALAKKIDHELKAIEINEQDEKQRQVERAAPPRPSEKKAYKRAEPDKAAPAAADAFQ